VQIVLPTNHGDLDLLLHGTHATPHANRQEAPIDVAAIAFHHAQEEGVKRVHGEGVVGAEAERVAQQRASVPRQSFSGWAPEGQGRRKGSEGKDANDV
jgi:hypothetical protein